MLKIVPIFSIFFLPIIFSASSVAAMTTEECQSCHGEVGSMPASLVIDPVGFGRTAHALVGCPECHVGVNDGHPEVETVTAAIDCNQCHDGIAEEYGGSVHAANASCSDCHDSHAVRGSDDVSGYDINSQCTLCHDMDETTSSHGEWLSQAGLHMESLPCITCHTGSTEYVIHFYLALPESQNFRPATFDELAERVPGGNIRTLVDINGDDFISLAELKAFNAPTREKNIRLKGMMVPQQVTHSYQILDNRWDCTFCHASGPEAMQTSVLTIPSEDGSYAQLPVEKGAALDALYGTPDFYMMGATRNPTMNLIGLVILAGGLVMPVGHGTLRFLTRNNRKEH